MPPKRQSLDIGTAFEITCEHLGRALSKSGSIRLLDTTTSKLKIALTAARTSQTAVPHSYLAKLVPMLDSQPDACRRLNPKSYVAILESILHAGYSRLKERGVYLLAASISCHSRTPSANTPKLIRRRKAAIGKGCMWAILNCFTNPAEDVRIRRWVGVLISGLLDCCEDNITVFKAGPEVERRKLGATVVEERNEILRTSCGRLLRELIAQGIPPEHLWPVNSNDKVYSEFPTSSQDERSWNQAFQIYVDQLSADSNPPDMGNLYFPLAVIAEGCEFNAAGCHINLLVDNELSIYATSEGNGFDQSLDVPVHLVSDVVISETLLDDGSRAPDQPLVVVVTLQSEEEASCYLNALPVAINEVHISVHDDKTAEVMGLEIDNASKRPKVSQTSDTITIGFGNNEWPLMESQPSPDSSIVISGVEKSKSESNLINCPSPGARSSPPQEVSLDSYRQSPDVPYENFIQQINSLDSKNRTDSAVDHASLVNVPIHEGTSDESREIANSTRFYQSPGPRGHSAFLDLNDNPSCLEDFYKTEPQLRRSLKDIPEVQGALLIPSPGERLTNSPTNKLSPWRQFNEDVCNELGEDPVSFALPMMAIERGRIISVDPKAHLTKDGIDAQTTEDRSRTKRYRVKPKPQLGLANASAGKQSSARVVNKAPEVSLVTDAMAGAKTSGAPQFLAEVVPSQNRSTSQNIVTAQVEAVRGTSATSVGDIRPDELAIPSENDRCSTAYSAKLSEMLEGIGDSESRAESSEIFRDEPETQSWIEEPQSINMARNLRKSLSSPGNSPRVTQKHVGPLYHEKVVRARQRAETPIRRSPRGLFRTKDAAAVLNSVLSHSNELLDDRLIRKTPLVGFSSRGPRNQGSSSAKPLAEPRMKRVIEAPSSRLEQEKNLKGYELKRKRSTEVIKERANDKRYQIGTFQNPLVAFTPRQGEGQQDDHDDLPVMYCDEPDCIPTKRTPVVAQKRGLGSQISRVDENGSPHASSITHQQREQYRATTSRVLMTDKVIGKTTSNHAQRPHRSSGHIDLQLPQNFDLRLPDCAAYGGSNRWQPSPECSDETLRPYASPRYNALKECMPLPHAEDEVVSRHKLRKTSTLKAVVSSSHTENENVHHGPKERITIEDTLRMQKKVVAAKGQRLASPLAIRRHDLVMRTSQDEEQYDFSRQKEYSPHPYSKTKAHTREDLGEKFVVAQDDVQMGDDSSSSDEDEGARGERQHTDELSRKCNENAERIPLKIWREALKPHQRAILDSLCLISSELVKYLINNEEAIADVLEEYVQYGSKLVEDYRQKQQADCQRLQQGLNQMKEAVEAELRESRLEILHSAQDVRTQPVGTIVEDWRQQQERVNRLIVEGKGRVG